MEQCFILIIFFLKEGFFLINNSVIKKKKAIVDGRTTLGIELGSTRIKAVLMDENYDVIAVGNHDWENQLVDDIWTYSIEDIWKGVRASYKSLADDAKSKYDVTITTIGAIGFSAMMHGYMVFDKEGEILVPFRTWRNTITEEASDVLTDLFDYNIPQRWSIAHLYQAILNKESHVKDINYLITLEGYVHWKLTGKKVLGIGDCAGMFPVDSKTKDFNQKMINQFDKLVEKEGFSWKLRDVFPKCLLAGEFAGELTKEGAKLLDSSGNLQAGIPFCPPEGDAGTGMVATNSVAKRTGNVSAGTSVFAMLVMEEELKNVHKEIDIVTTPSGDPVAMVHCNNCTSDINAWVNIFKEFSELIGVEIDMDKLFSLLFNKALEGDPACGGLLSYGYYSGEHITNFEEGRPLFVRTPNAKFNLANFMKTHLYSSLGALKIGLDILAKEENVKIDQITGHGGFFKTKAVGQRIMAAATNSKVAVMDTAGEGGAWGIALLASYMLNKDKNETLVDYLNDRVFIDKTATIMEADKEDIKDYEIFTEHYIEGLAIERAAIERICDTL